MKHYYLKALTLLFYLLFGITAHAHDFEAKNSDGVTIYYNITSSTDNTVSVTYRGSDSNEYSDEYTGNITIPETVTYNSTTYSVTSIGEEAFSRCADLTSITIPNSVTRINSFAFRDCTSLNELIIEDGESELFLGYNYYDKSGIGQGLFYSSPLETIYLGRNLSYFYQSSYGYSPFYYLNTLQTVTIGNCVTSIGYDAFDGCSGLTSVNISDIEAWCKIDFASSYANPLYYSQKLYLNGELLTELVIPNSIKEIKDYAFRNCFDLKSITIPNSVTSIGNYAFNNCFGLTSITIPNSVTSIGSYAFESCSGLTNITIPNSVTSIGNYAFYRCTGLTSVTVPNSVKKCGTFIFRECISMTSVEFNAENCNSMYFAFLDCSSLTNVTIGEKVKKIPDQIFEDCDKITNITIPNSVTNIGSGAFRRCTGLTNIIIPNSVTNIGNSAFWYCTNLTSIKLSNNITRIGDGVFYDCSSLTSITIPNSVTSIGASAFRDCSSLISITIPNSVTSIDVYAFESCTGLTQIEIPNSVTSIGQRAFYNTGWYNNQPDGILYLSNCCLGYKVNKPTSNLILEESTRLIGDFAFDDCDGLTSIECNAKTPPILGDNAFSSTSAILKVPFTHYYNYKETDIWKDFDFAKYEVDGICYLPTKEQDAMVTSNENAYIGNVVIPNEVVIDDATYSVTQIGESAFKDCTKLINLTISENITKINDYAFYGDKSIRTITCNAITPPTCGTDVFNSVKTDAVILTVPQESILLYQTADVWFDFWNIVGGVTTGIEGTLANDTEEAEYYNLQGVRVMNPERGLYIKRQGGKTTKVVL